VRVHVVVEDLDEVGDYVLALEPFGGWWFRQVPGMSPCSLGQAWLRHKVGEIIANASTATATLVTARYLLFGILLIVGI
jgi:hypothetical protein